MITMIIIVMTIIITTNLFIFKLNVHLTNNNILLNAVIHEKQRCYISISKSHRLSIANISVKSQTSSIYKFFFIYSFASFCYFYIIFIYFKKSTIIFRIPDSGIKPISWYQHSATVKSKISSNRVIRKGFPKTVYSGKLLSYILRDKYQLAITQLVTAQSWRKQRKAIEFFKNVFHKVQ